MKLTDERLQLETLTAIRLELRFIQACFKEAFCKLLRLKTKEGFILYILKLLLSHRDWCLALLPLFLDARLDIEVAPLPAVGDIAYSCYSQLALAVPPGTGPPRVPYINTVLLYFLCTDYLKLLIFVGGTCYVI